VFAYVDDIRNRARHMSESRSMPMTDAKLQLEIMTPNPTGVGAVCRYSGQMMGLTIDVSDAPAISIDNELPRASARLGARRRVQFAGAYRAC
jgi:hypothetical protein